MTFLEGLDSFDQAQVTRVRHRFHEHPLMKTESLMELAMRHEPKYVHFHDGEREFRTAFGDILSVDPERKALQRAIDNLGKTRVFVQITAICQDAIYRALIDEFLNELEQLLPRGDRGLLNRDAAAFLASPNSVTPFHLDHEQNFLLHLRGPKTLHVWNGDDRSMVSERALEIFYAEGTLQEVRYRAEFEPRAQVFEFGPGDGVFMPMGSPHAVKTGAGVTATFSMLFNTRSSVHEMEKYKANYFLRRFGFAPAPIGSAPAQEELKRRAYRALYLTKTVMRDKSLGRGDDTSRLGH